ncbi:ankyrin repeat domain-containing protein [Shewanella sp.]|uniref:ankyrin repeat domain-containing protein n=1 Tax=Shewanella sp. TaxID=50422 RepID=UPI003A96ACD0
MSLLTALKAEDYALATTVAATSCDADIRQALTACYFMQNLHRYWQATEFILLLQQRGIVSLALDDDGANSQQTDVTESFSPALLAALELEQPAPASADYVIGTELIIKQLLEGWGRWQDEAKLAALAQYLPAVSGLNANFGQLLRLAIQQRCPLTTIQQLVDAGCDAQLLSKAQENYLFEVVKSIAADHDQLAAYVDYFVAQGLNINHTNVVGNTPLVTLVKQGNIAAIDVLLSAGADADMTFANEQDLLEIALASGQLETIKHLQAHGLQFDFDKRDKEQKSLLYWFLDDRTRFHKGAGYKNDLKLLVLLLNDQPDLYQSNPDSYRNQPNATPMHRLLDHEPDVLQLALHLLHPDLNYTDEHGNTPLHLAAANYVNYEPARAEAILQRVKLLVSYGADVTLRNHQEQTAADVASDDDLKIHIVEWLKQQEANA